MKLFAYRDERSLGKRVPLSPIECKSDKISHGAELDSCPFYGRLNLFKIEDVLYVAWFLVLK